MKQLHRDLDRTCKQAGKKGLNSSQVPHETQTTYIINRTSDWGVYVFSTLISYKFLKRLDSISMFTNSICRDIFAVYFERQSDGILRKPPVPNLHETLFSLLSFLPSS